MIGQYRCTGYDNKLEQYSVLIFSYDTEHKNIKKYMVNRVGIISIARLDDHYTVKGMGDRNVIHDYPCNATTVEMLKFTILEMSKTILTAEITDYMETLF